MLTAILAAAGHVDGRQAAKLRRTTLSALHPDGAILLLGHEGDEGRPGPSPFRQENNFYYLTGCNVPGAALLLLPEVGSKAYREILFLPKQPPSDRVWDGPSPDPDDQATAELFGVGEVRRRAELHRVVKRLASRYDRVYSLLPAHREGFGSPSEPDRRLRVEALAPAALEDIRQSLTNMRLTKSNDELDLLRQAIDATVEAHLAAWRLLRPGLKEYQIAAEMTHVLLDRGCRRHAYPPIVAAGANSLILHYIDNQATIAQGDLVLIDVGGEFGHYAADVTRTVPASGRFTARQREIYDVVLAANLAVLQAAKPGMRLSGDGSDSLSQVAKDVFDAVEPGLSKRFPHSIGHYAGLAVHDPGSQYVALAEGMVITIEPGIYLPDEGWGVRIEDMAVITADGARLLTGGLPRDADEIEALMAAR